MVKGEIPADGLPTLVKLSPLHFGLKILFQENGWAEFEMALTLLSSFHPRYFYVTSHQVAAVEGEGLSDICSRGLAFVPDDVDQAVLEVSPDCVATPIPKFAFVPTDCSCAWPPGRLTAPEIGFRQDLLPGSWSYTYRGQSIPGGRPRR